mmetsp:Transcript_45292/g.128117  ORF Transcript_45292/g.128117 Transcript_45292/m.128117 type:complete len:283 (-) Transcript_45292:25-873(-)
MDPCAACTVAKVLHCGERGTRRRLRGLERLPRCRRQLLRGQVLQRDEAHVLHEERRVRRLQEELHTGGDRHEGPRGLPDGVELRGLGRAPAGARRTGSTATHTRRAAGSGAAGAGGSGAAGCGAAGGGGATGSAARSSRGEHGELRLLPRGRGEAPGRQAQLRDSGHPGGDRRTWRVARGHRLPGDVRGDGLPGEGGRPEEGHARRLPHLRLPPARAEPGGLARPLRGGGGDVEGGAAEHAVALPGGVRPLLLVARPLTGPRRGGRRERMSFLAHRPTCTPT